jgi:hypothetical protein
LDGGLFGAAAFRRLTQQGWHQTRAPHLPR